MDGSAFGLHLSYAAQPEPGGLPQAFLIGEEFLNGEPCALILGDNIFHGDALGSRCRDAITRMRASAGATVFAYRVDDPDRYGVVSFDKQSGKPVAIEEKPVIAASPWALTGLYFCDGDVVEIARSLKPSARGELEIVDVLRAYMADGRLDVAKLGRGYAWLDTGTHDSLHDASSFVRTIEHRQGIKIACPEEIAMDLGYIDGAALMKRADEIGKTPYATYLRACAEAA